MEVYNEITSFPYAANLIQIFPNLPLNTIRDTILLVREQTPLDDAEYQLENMIDMLVLNDADESQLLDEATLPLVQAPISDLTEYYNRLIKMFPDACPTYVMDLCQKQMKNGSINFDFIVVTMNTCDYPKREADPSSVYEQLKLMLPNADPSYLEEQANSLIDLPSNALDSFVDNAIERENYPTFDEYLKNKKETQLKEFYTTGFNVHAFLKEIPNPELYFLERNGESLVGGDELSDQEIKERHAYAVSFLQNHYLFLRKKDISKVFTMCNQNLYTTCQKLDRMPRAFKIVRQLSQEPPVPLHVPLLQEVAYLKNKLVIRRVLKQHDEKYQKAREEALQNDLMQTCQCCFDDELIPEECYFCKNGCIFCKDCVKFGAETAIGDGKLYFSCLANCGSDFGISTLQMVLDSVVFSRLAQRMQMEEVKQANLDGLESCPFCDFSTIPEPFDKIFHCLNPDCMKESCRSCRHEAHIPLRCNEIEYDEDVKMRTYIENKMTEALLRKCWKCSKVFIKESGCNKMTCSCGAMMCYVCRQAVTNYKHFENGSCSLYTELRQLHLDNVIAGANAAKAELGIDRDPSKLKIDPATNLDIEAVPKEG